jgi:gas vesicle protein
VDDKGVNTMATGMESRTLTSPLRKLVQFFRRSRDGWKAKYQQCKRLCKRLHNQVRAVEKSREHWREIARECQEQMQELKQELAANKNAIA